MCFDGNIMVSITGNCRILVFFTITKQRYMQRFVDMKSEYILDALQRYHNILSMEG